MSDTLPLRMKRQIAADGADVSTKQPYSVEQLLIMALLAQEDGGPMTAKMIYMWIFENFSFCRHEAAEAFWEDSYGLYRGPGTPDNFRVAMEKASRRTHDLPISVIFDAKHKPFQYSVSTCVGERFLMDAGILPATNNADRSIFAFFDLPPELHNRIYEFVFRYPVDGLYLEPFDFVGLNVKSVGDAFILKADSLDAPPSHRLSHRIPEYPPRDLALTRPIKQILSPRLINKQFNVEATPFFFCMNRFFFGRHQTMARALERMGKNKQYIEHIGVHIPTSRVPQNVPKSLGLLAHCTNLRNLIIDIDEDDYLGFGNSRGRQIKSMPGITALGKLRGSEHVTFFNCPTIESLLKAKMLRPKKVDKEVGGPSKGQKRKVEPGSAQNSERGERVRAVVATKRSRRSGN